MADSSNGKTMVMIQDLNQRADAAFTDGKECFLVYLASGYAVSSVLHWLQEVDRRVTIELLEELPKDAPFGYPWHQKDPPSPPF